MKNKTRYFVREIVKRYMYLRSWHRGIIKNEPWKESRSRYHFRSRSCHSIRRNESRTNVGPFKNPRGYVRIEWTVTDRNSWETVWRLRVCRKALIPRSSALSLSSADTQLVLPPDRGNFRIAIRNECKSMSIAPSRLTPVSSGCGNLKQNFLK